ncbi:MAG: hypothetical protein WDO68_02705 [Gammaproteobacteria bacterium]
MDCKTQFDTGFSAIVTDIRERRFEVVDRTKGLAFGWGYFDHNGTVAKFTNTPDHKPADAPQLSGSRSRSTSRKSSRSWTATFGRSRRC